MRNGRGRKGKLVLKKQAKFAQEEEEEEKEEEEEEGELRNRSFEKGVDDKGEPYVEGELTGRCCGLRKEMGWAWGTALGSYRSLI